jgi:Zn-dependent peptidase ImmA (M78 family)
LVIPQKIKILGLIYDIEQVDYISREKDLAGQFSESCLKILLRKDLPDQLKEQTLIHEIVHAILNSIGSEKYEDEFFVTSFANVLHQIITDNLL